MNTRYYMVIIKGEIKKMCIRDRIHRPRNPEIYKAPYVLFKKGLDCADYSIRCV